MLKTQYLLFVNQLKQIEEQTKRGSTRNTYKSNKINQIADVEKEKREKERKQKEKIKSIVLQIPIERSLYLYQKKRYIFVLCGTEYL